MLSNQEIVGRNGWFIPDVLGTWIEGSAVDQVGYLSLECPPLLFSERLVLTHTVECLSNGFDKRLHNSVLMACVRGVPLPLEIAGKFLRNSTLNPGNVPVLHYLSQVFLCSNEV